VLSSGAAGAVGFSSGLVFGGIIQAFLNWQWIFRISAMLVGAITLAGVWVLPPDAEQEGPKPAMDFMGAGFGTAGLVLLVFCLESGGIYGWGKVSCSIVLVSPLVNSSFT
jgi:MFS family permease